MKLNTRAAITNLKGEPIKDADGQEFTVGQALAEILLASPEGGKMKMYVLAQKLYGGKEVELDAADARLVKATVENTKAYNNLVTGQLLLLLDASENRVDKGDKS